MPESPTPPLFHSPTDDEPWDYTLYIPHDLRAATVGRRTLRLILTLHGLPDLLDAAELLAAELISNALRHTKGPAALRVRWAGGALRIGVWDTDPRPPTMPTAHAAAPEAEGGRGLTLVESCARAWGWYPLVASRDGGKYVWCEVPAA